MASTTSSIASPKEEKWDPQYEVQWDGPDDPTNPQNWPMRTKWGITALVSLQTLNVTFASSAPAFTAMQVSRQFGTSLLLTDFMVNSAFLCGFTIGPTIMSTFSELYGRRNTFIGAVALYLLFLIGQPLAKNTETFAVTRFLSGLSASAPLAISAGCLVDVHSPLTRGLGISLFMASLYLGPAIGPLVGAHVTTGASWQWVFWVMLIFGGVCWIILALGLPETYQPLLLMRKAQKLRAAGDTKVWAPHEQLDFGFSAVVKRALLRPLQIMAMEPILILLTIYLAVIYGVLYGLFQSVPIVFIQIHGFSLKQSSLIFIAVAIGTTLGVVLNVILQRKYIVLLKIWKDFVPPEERLVGSFVAAPLLVISLFWYGWTGAYSSIHWIVPTLALIPFGMSLTLIYVSLMSYIGDVYLLASASAFASNTMVRSAVGAAFPMFSRQLWDPNGSITPRWAGTLLGGIALLLAPSPFLFYHYGPAIRQWSRFAPCVDFKIREQLEKEGILPPDSLHSKDPDARTGMKEWLRRQQEPLESQPAEKRESALQEKHSQEA